MSIKDKFWEIWRDPYLLAFIFSFNHGTNGDIAARIGYLDGIRYSTNLIFTDDAMDYAARYGHLDVIKWLHENRIEGCTPYAMLWASANDHLDVIKFLHENREEGCSVWAMNRAAASGHLHIVKWLHENRKEGCTTNAMNRAAANGHLFIVKWLHENRKEGCTMYAMKWAQESVKVVSRESFLASLRLANERKRYAFPECGGLYWLCKVE